MTKAEAIAMLKRIQEPEAWEPQINQAAFEALDMAIEALDCSESPNSSDTISRQAAIDAFDGVKVDEENCTEYDIGYNDGIDFAVSKLSVLPSAQPEQRWIPRSERLPEKNCRCLTTNTAWGAFEVDFNVWINGEWLYPNEKPIAWMPLPKGYKGE